MKKRQLITWIICVALLSISTTILLYSFYKVKHVESMPMKITIDDKIVLNDETSRLDFGGVMRGGCSQKHITARHEYDYPLKASISIIGELSSWTSIEDFEFVLNKDEEKEVSFKVCAPLDAIMLEEYTSTARIAFKRP